MTSLACADRLASHFGLPGSRHRSGPSSNATALSSASGQIASMGTSTVPSRLSGVKETLIAVDKSPSGRSWPGTEPLSKGRIMGAPPKVSSVDPRWPGGQTLAGVTVDLAGGHLPVGLQPPGE